MTFLSVYITAFSLSMVFGLFLEWMENQKGDRAITGKNALINVTLALIPLVNIGIAFVTVALSIAVFIDMWGFFDWVERSLDRLQKITLVTDRK